MTESILNASPRTVSGKNAMRKLRSSGIVPAVIYGLHEPQSIQLNAREATKMVHDLHGSERLISLKIDGSSDGRNKAVLLKEVQTTAVGSTLLHIDFHEVDVSLEVQVSVEIRPNGKALGETLGGILQQVTHEITVECLPTIIPEFISADVAHLEVGHSLHVSDLIFPEGVKAITSVEETLFVVAAPRVEEVALGDEEEGEEDAGAVPVVGKEAPSEETSEDS